VPHKTNVIFQQDNYTRKRIRRLLLHGSRCSVDVDTRRTLDGPELRVSAKCGIFCLSKHVRTGPGANLSSYSMGAEIIFQC